MQRIIDIEKWNRKEHFLFFGAMDDPFFGVTAPVDMTDLYNEAKEDKASFFIYSLHKIMKAVNETEEFRYRTDNGKVVCFDTIHATSTIGRKDGTFGFGFIEYSPDRKQFEANALKEIERIQKLSGLCYSDSEKRKDIIRFSPVSWIAFTEMKHAGSFNTGDSVPRISTGRLTRQEGKLLLPVSINAHHGLMDGKHAADLLDRIEKKTTP